MAESAQKMLHELTSAGLLSSDHVTRYGAELETGVEALLTKLISDGHITEYQADKFRQGNGADIHLGDYVVIDKLGQGGMGTVLLAKHRRMKREVAIKVLPVTVLESKDAVARFYQEVEVAAQLTHPNIVHAYDAGEQHGFHYLVMEYVRGHDLAEVLSQLGLVPATLALDYIAQAAAGLDYAHRKGVVHRDIKPSNLLLDNEGNIKILDMGLARLGNNSLDQQASVHLTTTGQVMGTVEYMSPEQAEDTRQADARSDIYSLGCTLYRLVTGRGPYSRDTVIKTILAHRDAPIPTIQTDGPDETTINQLFRRMVAKNPEHRFQSAAQLVEAIRQLEENDNYSLDSPPIVSRPAPVPVVRDTAVAFRYDSRRDSSAAAIPEAIIPEVVEPSRDDRSRDEPISFTRVNLGDASAERTQERQANSLGSHPSLLSGGSAGSVRDNPRGENWEDRSSANGRQASEVIYIPDIADSRKPGVIGWIRQRRSNFIFVLGVISLLTIAIPFGFVVAFFTARTARRELKRIRKGERPVEGRWLTRAGRVMAIIGMVFGILVNVAYLSCLAQ